MCFFFFKQKTAYEMRISDWSSDVCSSDLKVSGTDGNAVFYTARNGFRWIKGEDNIGTYEVPGQNGWRSSFCRTCGSPTPHTDRDGKIFFIPAGLLDDDPGFRSEEHTSELQSLMRISYAVFCLKTKQLHLFTYLLYSSFTFLHHTYL